MNQTTYSLRFTSVEGVSSIGVRAGTYDAAMVALDEILDAGLDGGRAVVTADDTGTVIADTDA